MAIQKDLTRETAGFAGSEFERGVATWPSDSEFLGRGQGPTNYNTIETIVERSQQPTTTTAVQPTSGNAKGVSPVPPPPRNGPVTCEELKRMPAQECAARGIDSSKKEQYLSPDEFASVFDGMSLEDFQGLPQWKRANLKKAAGLF